MGEVLRPSDRASVGSLSSAPSGKGLPPIQNSGALPQLAPLPTTLRTSIGAEDPLLAATAARTPTASHKALGPVGLPTIKSERDLPGTVAAPPQEYDSDVDDPPHTPAGAAAGGASGGAGGEGAAGDAAVEALRTPVTPGAGGDGEDGGEEGAEGGEGADVMTPETPTWFFGEKVPLTPQMFKVFSSNCMRRSFWPTPVNRLPPRGYEKLAPGKATLEKFKEDRVVRLLAVTWNMHAKPPPEDLSELVPRDRYHVVVIGSCECERSIAASAVITSKEKWEATLTELLGPNYVKVRSHALQAIHEVAFVHKSINSLTTDIQSAAIACGVGNTLGNKGGVGISFSIDNTSFLFVSCHLAAHQNHVEARNADFHRINTQLPLWPSKGLHRLGGVSERFDRVVWLGDMNYRVNGSRKMVDRLLLDDMHEVLVFNDQLRIERAKKAVFDGFMEGPLHFRPTYKFDKNSATYDSSVKMRVPSWTDRVLYRSLHDATMVLKRYDSIDSIRTSDHRPVVAVFEVELEEATSDGEDESKGGDDNAEDTTGGAAEGAAKAPKEEEQAARERAKSVALAIAKRRSHKVTPTDVMGHSESQVCSIQ